MDIVVRQGTLLNAAVPIAVLGVWEDDSLPEVLAALGEAGDFQAHFKQSQLLYPRNALPPRRILLIGLGKRAEATPDTLRQYAALAVQRTRDLQLETLTVAAPSLPNDDVLSAGQALAEGLELGSYRFLTYRTNLSAEQTFQVSQATIYTEGDAAPLSTGAHVGQAVARGVSLARDLANTPGNVLTPARLADAAHAVGTRYGMQLTIYGHEELEREGFGGILAVGQGSANPPRFVVMEHGSRDHGPTICLVGKGITFDTGGISIKPAEKMEDMKMDMGGAAAVIGAMEVVGALKLPLHVVALIASAENMPSGTAYRPGDIITTLSGKTIEVLNTDAEGRIVLADALFYAQRYAPRAIIDLATLTGAIMVALGAHATGLMTNNQALADDLIQAGTATAERVWQLPLWDEYRDMMKSDIADLKNTGGRYGGAITAAGFLAAFVGDYPWAHLDIAGTAWTENPNRPYVIKGATGVGVRLLVQMLQQLLKD